MLKRIQKESIYELIAFALCLFFIVTLWGENMVLFVVLIILYLIGNRFWHKKHDYIFFIIGAALGSVAEAICTYFGVWTYVNPTILNIPIWLPITWGIAAVLIVRIAENFVKIESIGSIKKSTKLKTKKIALTLLGVGVFVFALIFVFSMFSIYSSVEAMCTQVRSQYEGDCVEGLIQYVESEEHDYEEKNRAIWALGQLADERALPTLNQFYEFSYAEVPCKRDLHICREEVEKAIKWCTKGNVTSWMYNF